MLHNGCRRHLFTHRLAFYEGLKTINQIWQIAILISIYGKATFKNLPKEILYPFDSAIPTVTTLAEAPMMVPLPPKQAPKDRAHHSVFSPPGSITFER